jgi:hypothetical protein
MFPTGLATDRLGERRLPRLAAFHGTLQAKNYAGAASRETPP